MTRYLSFVSNKKERKNKKKNINNAPKLKYPSPLSTHNFEVLGTVQAEIQALLKKRKKGTLVMFLSQKNQNRT